MEKAATVNQKKIILKKRLEVEKLLSLKIGKQKQTFTI